MSALYPHAPVPASTHVADRKPRKPFLKRIAAALDGWLIGDDPSPTLSRFDVLDGVGAHAATSKEQS